MLYTLAYPELGYECELRTIRGKNVSLTVYPNNKIIIRRPKRVSLIFLHDFLKERKDWVKTQYEKNELHNPKKASFEVNEILPIFGINRKVEWTLNQQSQLTPTKLLVNNQGIRSVNGRIKRSFSFLKDELEKKVIPLLAEATNRVGTKKYIYRFRAMKSLWGSCSAKNDITLNLALAFCPDFVIRYVVYHEVAHTREHNHSNRYWALLESLEPEYREAEKWIAVNGKKTLCYLF